MAQQGAFSIAHILSRGNKDNGCTSPQVTAPAGGGFAASQPLHASLTQRYPYMAHLWRHGYQQYSIWATALAHRDAWRRPVCVSVPSDTAQSSHSEGYASLDDEEEASLPETAEIREAGDSSVQKRAKSSFSKKKRTTFTTVQLQQLECRFNEQKYLTKLDRSALADSIGLTEKHVKTWYQNRRTKWKKDCSEEDWSRAKEFAATQMYSQYLKNKPKENSSSL